jgi:hypothetical protein
MYFNLKSENLKDWAISREVKFLTLILFKPLNDYTLIFYN